MMISRAGADIQVCDAVCLYQAVENAGLKTYTSPT
jgi:hypothetical protein